MVSSYDDPSTSETYRDAKAAELMPIGIINEQNTCFLNSTFQAVSATAPLISILSPSAGNNLFPVSTSLLPKPAVPPSLVPSNRPEVLEPPLYQLLPVTHAFISSLQRAWHMKDAGGGTWGEQEMASHRSMTLRDLLLELSRKYDQYDGYQQQDAHELLRHLLDSMEMEERDVIKRVQPAALIPPKRRRSKKSAFSPMHSPSPSRAPSPEPEIPEKERMVPFVDVLFGGNLASVVVCEHCKSVSHTYEGFFDISLSLKAGDPKPRKRDRFKAMASKFVPKHRSPPESHSTSSASLQPAVMSDTELSDSETQPRDRRRSLDADDRDLNHGNSHSRSNSSKFSLGKKPSFSFRKTKSRTGSMTSASSVPIVPEEQIPKVPSMPSSPKMTMKGNHGPSAAQSAYIRRILNQPQPEDPLAKLRAANFPNSEPLDTSSTAKTGLEESLEAFTSVEVLEGENAFACKRCWMIQSGRYGTTVQEEDESAIHITAPSSPEMSSLHPSSESSSQHLGRAGSMASRSSASANHRAPSPLRRQLDVTGAMANLNLPSDMDGGRPGSEVLADPESDGLSDSDTTDEEPPPELPDSTHRPKHGRTKSSHFVMRRAFKRYLFAKAPEVLILHFKRFKQTTKTSLVWTSFYDLKKVDDFVSFPETLDLSPYMAPDRNDYKVVQTAHGPRAPYMDWSSDQAPHTPPVNYRLYALVVHMGTMIGGHYIAYCLVDPERMFGTTPAEQDASPEIQHAKPHGHAKKDRRVWCFCSDTSIRLADVDEVLSQKAYLCFYERVRE